ncbi:MAG TPA: Fe-S cluster assembly protein SufD [Kiritimatiellia bacterium]|nr:Fe-S cluster assembly protein SufD [Kiritimatiellia bacterium]
MTTDVSKVQVPVNVPGFDGAMVAALSVGEPALLSAARAAALEKYRSLPMPSRRDEEWKRTEPDLFPFDRVKPLPLLPREEAPVDDWNDKFDVVVHVRSKGYSIRDVSGVLAAGGVKVLSFAEAARDMGDAFAQYLQGHAQRVGAGKFDALGDACWNVGLFVQVPPRCVLERGILIRYEHDEDLSVLVPRLVIVVGEGAQAAVAEQMVSPDGKTLMVLPSKEIYIGEKGNLKLVSLQEWGDDTYHISSDWAVVSRDAQLDWATVNLGGKVCKMVFGSDGAGQGARSELHGLYFATGEQHMDQRTLQVHSAPDTYSNLLYKGAVLDRAHSVYQGLIIARKGAIRVDAYQKNNNLVLSDGARADSLPGLEIDADDLKCSHGSTIGNLDEDEVFYLRSRGLSDAQARKMLITGFFEQTLEKVPFEFIKEYARERIEAKMGRLMGV